MSYSVILRLRGLCIALNLAAFVYLGFCIANHTRGPLVWIAWGVTFVCGTTNLILMQVERRRVQKAGVDSQKGLYVR
jgi:hypothetical protein